MQKGIYNLYHNGKLVYTGTKNELVEFSGLALSYINYLATAQCHNTQRRSYTGLGRWMVIRKARPDKCPGCKSYLPRVKSLKYCPYCGLRRK